MLIQKQFIFCLQNLVVCNAGLANGMQLELLLNEANQFGSISNIVMIKEKTYCFIKCSNVENAVLVYENLHGKCTLGQHNGPLYLSYCDKGISITFYSVLKFIKLDETN